MTVSEENPMDNIEKDALQNTPESAAPTEIHDHQHEVKTFYSAPKQGKTFMDMLKGMFSKQDNAPTNTVFTGKDGKRYMFLITSNSYEDREGETITGKALQEYVESCWKADDVFMSDNPLLWWHDDAVPMGEIVFAEYEEPFLIELAKELDDPIARVLWDYAETAQDAGTSHRFGYYPDDREADGTYKRIFKTETTYLPERKFAANGLTYAGVINKMADTRAGYFDQIFEQLAGVKDASAKLKTGKQALVQELQAAGIQHKNLKMDGAMMPEELLPEQGKAEGIEKLAEMLAAMQQIVMDMVGAQETGMIAETEMAKALRVLDERNKALEARLLVLEQAKAATPRSVTQDTVPTEIPPIVAQAMKHQNLTAEQERLSRFAGTEVK